MAGLAVVGSPASNKEVNKFIMAASYIGSCSYNASYMTIQGFKSSLTSVRLAGHPFKFFNFALTSMNFSTFRAFQSRNYRLYFAGQSISLIGTWMQKTAVSWIVYILTHSTFMLGLSLFASQFPSFLLSLLGGVVSDRYNRFKVLLTTQIASMIQSLLLALIVLLGHYQVWEIISLGTVLGTINAFDVPARQALVYDMIGDKRDLPNVETHLLDAGHFALETHGEEIASRIEQFFKYRG